MVTILNKKKWHLGCTKCKAQLEYDEEDKFEGWIESKICCPMCANEMPFYSGTEVGSKPEGE